MFAGAFALMERSFRLDARSRSTHLIRLSLMVAIYLALCSAITTGILFGAPGLNFFRSIAFLDMVFLTLLGIGFFSSVITEEKEEDTLGLMLMAGISPLGILAGKSIGGLWQAILLIAIQHPFTLLAVTMGGVTSGQVWAVTIALMAYVAFLAGFGLLCSTTASTNKAAAWRMTGGLIAYFALPSIAMSLSLERARRIAAGTNTWSFPDWIWTLVDGISGICIFLQMENILATGFGESAFGIQVISNIAMGAIFVGLAWLLFGVTTRNLSSEASTRGLVARRPGLFRITAGRAWSNPFLWKDFYFVSGGVGMTVLRTTFFIFLGLIPWFGTVLIAGSDDEDWLGMSISLIVFSASISAASVLARSMHDEIRGQTLATLMMLPRSSAGIVYSKYAGALLGWLPGPVIGPIMLFANKTFREGVFDLLGQPFPQINLYIFTTILLAFLIVVLFFVLTPHFAAYLALHVRWGAVPLAIALSYFVMMVVGMVTMIFSLFVPGNQIDPVAGMALLAIFLFCLCGTCHIGILLRVQALSAK